MVEPPEGRERPDDGESIRNGGQGSPKDEGRANAQSTQEHAPTRIIAKENVCLTD